MYTLYKITNTVNNKSYIGITKLTVDQRWQRHKSSAINPKVPFHCAIAKYSPSAFSLEVLTTHTDRKIIGLLEEDAIQQHQTHITHHGYNVAKGGYGGDLGAEANAKRLYTIKNKSTEEKERIREKLRAAAAGKTKENNLGRRSQAEKMKGNTHRTGIPHSDEVRDKITKSNTGKQRSEIARQNLSNSAKIRGTGPQLQGKKVCCLCCDREWDLGNFTQHIRKHT